jgi:hypothetical protein
MSTPPDATSPETGRTREPWDPPELVEIDLKAEQVLAVGCKNASGVARLGQPSCGFASGCNTIGS